MGVSAWGKSWGVSWGNSWGQVEVVSSPYGGVHGTEKTKRNNKIREDDLICLQLLTKCFTLVTGNPYNGDKITIRGAL